MQKSPSLQPCPSGAPAHGAHAGGNESDGTASTPVVTESQPAFPGPAAQPHQLLSQSMLPAAIDVPEGGLPNYRTLKHDLDVPTFLRKQMD